MTTAQKEELRAAVKALTREANHLEDYREELEDALQPSLPWVNSDPRPHQRVHDMGPAMAPHVLERMLDEFTGNLRRDLYIRWHLLHVVKQARPGQRETMGQQLMQLLQKMPGPLEVELKEKRKHVPEDRWSKYWSLREKTHIVEGYPPFERHHWGRSSLEHVRGSKKQKLKKTVEKMEKLRENIEVKVDEAAKSFNRRVRRLQYMTRRYRGELLYEVLRTGDPKILKVVTKEVVNRAGGKDVLAFDLLSFMYLAALDGVLNQYPDDALQTAGSVLQRAAQGMEGYEEYEVGEVSFQYGTKTEKRNFADYAFHLVKLMRDPELLKPFGTAAGSSGSTHNRP